jgi:TrmH family RNA methyltransferase
VRATAGSLFHVPVLAVGSTTGALRELRQAGYRLLATALAAESLDLFDAEDRGLLEGRVAWIFGNEAHGLPAEVLADCDHIIRIPILGRAESLNLATAGAVSLYAVARAARRGR